ncbi:unnamed protein product [Clavelina lepadiformis]|uniref:Uncharacterized protein n=1 Tax=Clavelina lepadiformis TaxID=159417 RepID=A0ABP0FD11_CLALP
MQQNATETWEELEKEYGFYYRPTGFGRLKAPSRKLQNIGPIDSSSGFHVNISESIKQRRKRALDQKRSSNDTRRTINEDSQTSDVVFSSTRIEENTNADSSLIKRPRLSPILLPKKAVARKVSVIPADNRNASISRNEHNKGANDEHFQENMDRSILKDTGENSSSMASKVGIALDQKGYMTLAEDDNTSKEATVQNKINEFVPKNIDVSTVRDIDDHNITSTVGNKTLKSSSSNNIYPVAKVRSIADKQSNSTHRSTDIEKNSVFNNDRHNVTAENAIIGLPETDIEDNENVSVQEETSAVVCDSHQSLVEAVYTAKSFLKKFEEKKFMQVKKSYNLDFNPKPGPIYTKINIIHEEPPILDYSAFSKRSFGLAGYKPSHVDNICKHFAQWKSKLLSNSEGPQNDVK